MFTKIHIANRGVRASGAIASVTNCMVTGEAGHVGEFTLGAHRV